MNVPLSLTTYCSSCDLTMGYCQTSKSFAVQSSDYFEHPKNSRYSTDKKIVYAALSHATEISGTYILNGKQRAALAAINSEIDTINKTQSVAIKHIKESQDRFATHLDCFNGTKKDIRELKSYFSKIELVNEDTLRCDYSTPLSANELNGSVVKGVNTLALPFIALKVLIGKVECVATICLGPPGWQCGTDDPARKIFACKPLIDGWEPLVVLENKNAAAIIAALLRGEKVGEVSLA